MSGLVCNCLSTVMASYWHCRITVTSSGNNVLNHLVLFVSARVILYSTFSFHCCLNMFTQVQMSTIAQVFLYQFYPFLNLFSLGCLPVSYLFFFLILCFSHCVAKRKLVKCTDMALDTVTLFHAVGSVGWKTIFLVSLEKQQLRPTESKTYSILPNLGCLKVISIIQLSLQ